MIDPLTISTLFTLFAAYGRERKTSAGEHATEEYRLQVLEFMDHLSEQVRNLPPDVVATLQDKLSGQSAALIRIEEMLGEVAQHMGLSSSRRVWGQLSEDEKVILQYLNQNFVSEWGPDTINLKDLSNQLGIQHDKIVRSARHLDEKGAVTLQETTGSHNIRITQGGMLLAWENCENTGAVEAVKRIHDCLIKVGSNNTEKVGTIAQRAGVTAPVTSAYINTLASMKMLRHQALDGPLEIDRIWDVSETLQREPPTLARVVMFALQTA